MKELWIRLGVTLSLTDEEADILLNGKTSIAECEKIVRDVIGECRFLVDGNSYVPENSIDDFNKKYGTDYERGDCELCW